MKTAVTSLVEKLNGTAWALLVYVVTLAFVAGGIWRGLTTVVGNQEKMESALTDLKDEQGEIGTSVEVIRNTLAERANNSQEVHRMLMNRIENLEREHRLPQPR